jgi:hypothetical protein
VVAAFSEQITNVFAIDLIVKVIQNDKRRFTLGVAVLFG